MAEQLNFGKIPVAIDGGDLITMENVGGTFEDGYVLVHSARDGRPIGGAPGKKSCTLNITANISDAGPERNVFRDWERNRWKEVRCKLPGNFVITVTGRVVGPGFSGQQDGASTMTFSVKGDWAFS
jgi:hypothetical protein